MPDRPDHPFDSAGSEAAGNQDGVQPFQPRFVVFPGQALRIDPMEPDPGPSRKPAVDQGLTEALVGLLIAHILADDPYGHFPFGAPDPVHEIFPGTQFDGVLGQTEEIGNDGVQTFLAIDQRDFVDAFHVLGRDNGF